ncbi:branched-chain amino acid ABC transporter permease [Microbacterium sp. ASV49]|uniref:Branched-chain amino acid ABC transporter permease n=1 Tax=Microbacterium candidum TaxID=3041922 RepID=A0ABT7MZW1_9MICO|nr:branched-chain amino acid ABC transporter permease [Microbacterium sp. ASV49]MDL9979990.1 branched-chain amino acid ABC transporter permease [Microbacterium sp. ASV49]
MARDLALALKNVPLRAPAPLFERTRPPRGILNSQIGFMRALGALACVFVVVLPFIDASRYTMSIATSALIYVMLSMGLNVVVGYAGLLDLGYIAFFAVGAYISGILTTTLGWPMWAALPATILACMLAGIIIGAPTLRLRSDYLAIVTLGFGEIIRITANNLDVTGGPSGIHGIPTWTFGGWSFDDGFTLGGIQFPPYVVFYYFVALIVVTVGVIGAGRLAKGKMGRAWKAVRDDEDAAEAMGINTYIAKISAYVIGAVWAGLAGQLMATHLSAISPNSFQFLYSVLILMAVVLGGMGSTPGVIIGALFVSLTPELLRDFAEWRYLIFGIMLIIVMLFRPAGLWPATAVLPWLKKKGRAEAPDFMEEPAEPSVMESASGLPAEMAEEGEGR